MMIHHDTVSVKFKGHKFKVTGGKSSADAEMTDCGCKGDLNWNCK